MNLKQGIGAAIVIAAAAGLWWIGRAPGPGEAVPRAMTSTDLGRIAAGAAIVAPALPARLSAEAEAGRVLFEANCIACHGRNAAGVNGSGPPLIHKIYEPSHHADYAFVLAVTQGVRAHHWPFGDMAPVAGLTQEDALLIAAYVRDVQRANGIGVK
ncbi:c-type cytochrome [Marimonas lutisalis]|uniref:c-type cytochrome n=1 Tax=Marimonas lutisalis TaxID=2545756 RepID=UPI0010F51988|nr:cytochrome c [Marimonas lutisalis]